MKRAFIFIMLALNSAGAIAQKHYDSLAIMIIDRMADVIGNIEACSFKLNTAQDVQYHEKGFAKQFTDYEVYISGPTKMLVNANGYKGHRQLWFNGQQLAFYSFDEHNYAMVPMQTNVIKMMDSINAFYGIEFPAADFFYPAFTDDLMENADSIRFLGQVTIHGKQYFHIVASGKDRLFQFWIGNDAYNLPARFSVTYKTLPGSPQYLAIFSDWQVNPNLPVAMFDFLPPPGANQVRLFSKNDR